jgi:hypothetical protein
MALKPHEKPKEKAVTLCAKSVTAWEGKRPLEC